MGWQQKRPGWADHPNAEAQDEKATCGERVSHSMVLGVAVDHLRGSGIHKVTADSRNSSSSSSCGTDRRSIAELATMQPVLIFGVKEYMEAVGSPLTQNMNMPKNCSTHSTTQIELASGLPAGERGH